MATSILDAALATPELETKLNKILNMMVNKGIFSGDAFNDTPDVDENVRDLNEDEVTIFLYELSNLLATDPKNLIKQPKLLNLINDFKK